MSTGTLFAVRFASHATVLPEAERPASASTLVSSLVLAATYAKPASSQRPLTASKIGRGEFFEALDFTAFLRARVLGPLALKEASAQPSGVRHVERVAPARARQMQETVARYDARDLVSALRAAVALYRELRNRAGVETLKRRNEAEAAALDYLDGVARRLGSPDAFPTTG